MKKIFLTIALVAFKILQSQILINEVCSANKSAVKDNEGDSPDWIELYNSGAAAVDLTGYRLTDNSALPTKWVFPTVTIPAGGYLSVFASGKNKSLLVNHWESLVLENNDWKYIIPSAEIPSWTSIGFNDASWSTGKGGLGYGDSDDGTTITTTTATSVYARRTVNVIDKSQIKAMRLFIDYDDGYVAYLNGTEIARSNMGNGTPAYNALATSTHEASVYSGGSYEEKIIDPSIFTPLLVNGNNVLSIEVHNDGASSTDMTMRAFLVSALGDGSNNYQAIPSFFTPPPASNSIHTNFKLSSSGSPVILYNSAGTLVNGIIVPAMQPDDSYGRFPNGSSTLKYLRPVTFNNSNGAATSYSGYVSDVVTFSVPAGFYSSTQSVTLTKVSSSSTIRYTLDGSEPTETSTSYSSPISVSTNTVIRAACFATGYLRGKIETNTYFIGQTVTLPVFSISSAPAGLFSQETGIYSDGTSATVASCPDQPYRCRNYWQDWERNIHVEYFDKGKTFQFEQDAGIKILGGWSRMLAEKSVQIRAGDSYGKSYFEYNFFDEPKKSHVRKFETLTLRNGGNDFEGTMLRDAINQRVINSNSCYANNIDFEGYTPVVVFYNGVYYGIHTLRERVDDSYFENNGGYKNVNYLEKNGTVESEIKEGTNSDFLSLINFINANDLTVSANYNQVKTMLDIDNYIDYFCAEIYHTNWDWPHNNIKFWKPVTGGKWRFIYHDTDFSYGLFNFASTTQDELGRMISDNASDETRKNVHTTMLQKLLTNTEFRAQFLNRMSDLLNTTYRPSYIKGIFDNLTTEISSEIGRHTTKWPSSCGGSSTAWNSNISGVKSFMDARPAGVRSSFVSRYSLGGTVSITLDALPAGSGKIKISTIAPCSLPFTGDYFRNIPVTIEVLPNAGYVFQNWTSSVTAINNSTATKFTTTLTGSTATFTANFTTTTSIPKLTFSEINYQSDTLLASNADAGDWVELYNYGNASIDISGWVLQDENYYNNYTIPAGTVIGAGQYLVFVNDVTKFKAVNPTVTNYIGPIGFNLSNDGETIKLIDNFNTTRVSVLYNDVSPWPDLANGKGGTLELIDPTKSLNDATNWKNGCKKGSPGKVYAECPCKKPNLGPDEIICMSGANGITLNTQVTPASNKTFKWYYNGTQIITSATNTYVATQPGTYSVVYDSVGCIKTDEVVLTNLVNLNIVEKAVVLCSPSSHTLNATVGSINATYAWYKNGILIPNETNSTLVVTSPGQYIVEVGGGSCTLKKDTVTFTSKSLSPVDGSRCGTGTVTLSVNGTISGRTYKWYSVPTGGTSLGTGTSFTTPSISSTTTYYVEDADVLAGSIGLTNINVDPNNIWIDSKHTTEPYRFTFDVLKACTLNYVTVFPEGAQTIVVNLYASNGTTKLQTVSVPVTSGGLQRIPVGFALSVGNGYYLDAQGTTGRMYYNGGTSTTPGVSNYPFTESLGFLKITGTSPSWAATGTNKWYPYLYKWEFSNGPVPCDRIPVKAIISCVSAVEYNFIKATSQTNSIKIDWQTSYESGNSYFEILRSTDGVNFSKIGASVNSQGSGNVVRNYTFTDASPVSGVVYYRIRQVSTNNSSSLSNIITINVDSSIVTVYNDEVLNQLQISSSASITDLVIYNTQGLVMLVKNNILVEELSVSSRSWPAGLYIGKFVLENGQAVTKTFFVK